MEPLNRLLCLLTLRILLLGMFEGMLLMRVTTVPCVTEQNVFSKKNLQNQLLRTLFNRYNVIHHTTRPHDPFSTRHINNKQRNAESFKEKSKIEAPRQDASGGRHFDRYARGPLRQRHPTPNPQFRRNNHQRTPQATLHHPASDDTSAFQE